MSDTKQPQWKLLTNLGDVNPVDHGGYLIFTDETGVYPPEAELLGVPDEDAGTTGWEVYRFPLDRCTLTDGVLSDNPYHPLHPAWFAEDLDKVAQFIGVPLEATPERAGLRNWLCSVDPIDRARAYRAIGDFHGFENLDQYPLRFRKRAEVDGRYKRWNF